MKKLIKSPLRYPGGKSRAAKFLYQYFPADFKEYREPFWGGGSMGIFTAQQRKNIRIIANDLNFDLHCFWTSLRDNHIHLTKGIRALKDSYKDGRQLYKFILSRRDIQLSNLERGIDFFILNRITFSGLVDSGGYSQKAFIDRFTNSSIERLITAHDIIKSFAFSSNNFSTLLEGEDKHVFIYLDPPYYVSTKSKLYGKKGLLHSTFSHEELYKSLSITKHAFLMTYDDSPYIRELYRDFFITEWQLQYGMNNFKQAHAKAGKELIITNYSLQNI